MERLVDGGGIAVQVLGVVVLQCEARRGDEHEMPSQGQRNKKR